MGSGLRICWVAVQEFNLSYYVGEAILVTIYIYILIHYGNLI